MILIAVGAAVLLCGTLLYRHLIRTKGTETEQKTQTVPDTAKLYSFVWRQSAENADALLTRLDEVSVRQKTDIVIVTVSDLENDDTPTALADDIYDRCEFGYGQKQDGILFLLVKESRDWAISTHGKGRDIFTDAGQNYIFGQMRDDLANDRFAAAFDTFVTQCDRFVTQANEGAPYDVHNLPREPLSAIWIPISVVIGLVLSLIIVGGMKGKLKTVRSQAAANSYVKEDSMNVIESSDLFLYHTVSRTARSKENSSSGGSSTHTSSSGKTHGGSSGKF